jgi:hypothetical protein
METMLVTDKSMGKNPRRNQKASSAARFTILLLTAPRQTVPTSSRQLNPANLGMAAMRVPSCLAAHGLNVSLSNGCHLFRPSTALKRGAHRIHSSLVS